MKKSIFKNIFRSRINIAILLMCALYSYSGYAQDPYQNYVMTTTYKVASPTPIQNADPKDVAIEITYIDGLGRPKQKIAHKQSGNGEDLITHIEYDGLGRQPMEFLPYERSASLDFDGNGYGSTTSFYSNPSNGPTTSNPWSQKLFEESPLNRILKQAAPGNDWAMTTTNSGHEIKFAYETNNNTEVHHFSVSLTGNTPSLTYEQKYPEGQLYKTITKDENWQSGDGNKGTVIQFKDKMGRMVLKRTFDIPIGETKSSTGSITMDTYYIYDAYGNLTFVLSPKLSAQIVSNGYVDPNLLEELGYQYQYDHRNRMIAKKIPGKHWEYMVYDALDRLIASGPALSPFGDQAEGWLHTKYDIFNRVAYTLWKQGTVNPSQREALANALPTYISEVRLYGNNKSSVNNVDFSYSNQVPPTSGYHVLTVNYYDDYLYYDAPETIPTTVGEGDIEVFYKKNSQKPKGLPTGSWVRELETAGQAKGINSYSLYDKKARPVRVKSSNTTSGYYTQSDTDFDFIGNPQYTITEHKKDAQASVLSTKDVFTYTDQSRPLKHTHKIGNGAEQLLSLNEYDALGRLKSKKVGGTNVSGVGALQKVDYKYNVRGWLTEINDVTDLSQQGEILDLFAFKINYNIVEDDINGAIQSLYNGNISETLWRTSVDNVKRKYGYAYDYQNRLLAAFYQKPDNSVSHTDSYSTNYSYDRNGNILSLERNGEQDSANQTIQIDELIYDYSDGGNQLTNVHDNEQSPAGYYDHHPAINQPDFDYDDYGNLIYDKDKDITTVEYNHLNLPTKILFGAGGKIEYFYDATGIKLKKKVTDGTTITTTEYMDGFQYKNNILDFFPHAEGYVKAVTNSLGGSGNTTYAFRYVFNYTDHLGNIRLKYAQNPSNNNQISVLEEDHYYPYGLKHKGYNTVHKVFAEEEGPIGGIVLTPVNPFLGDSYKYKFGGKEYDDTFDINTYDFGARNYDPALGRWMNIDPLAEMMRRHSPYNYAFDNPVFFTDPDGMAPGGFSDGYVNHNLSTSTGAVDVSSSVLTSFDGNGNTLDSQIVTGSDNVSVARDGGKISTEVVGSNNGVGENVAGTNNNSSSSTDPPNKWQKIFRAMRNAANTASYSSGISGMAQIGMLEYRQALPLESKIGTFGKFSSTYSGLGKLTRIGGNIGNIAAVGGVYYDYNEMTSGNISQTRFAYRTTSTFASIGSSIAVGSTSGGPWGAALGAFIGFTSVGAEIFYDWWDSNITPQINRSFQFNYNEVLNGFKY